MNQSFLIGIVMALGVLSATTSYSQSILGGIFPGFVITNQGDTLEGHIRLSNKLNNQYVAQFFKDAKGLYFLKEYKPKDIQAYRVADRYYESVNFGGLSKKTKHFLWVETKGGISIYHWYDNGPTRSHAINEEALEAEVVFQKIGESPVSFSKGTRFLTNFKKAMGELVADYPELATKVRNKEKGYRLLKAFDIIEEYNEWYKIQNAKE